MKITSFKTKDAGLSNPAFSEIEKLDLSYTPISHTGIANLAASAKSLQSLNLSMCPSLNDESIQNLNKLPPCLTSLNISLCGSLTEEAVKHLPPTLVELDLSGVPGVTVDTIMKYLD